jgi:hypothetical protein
MDSQAYVPNFFDARITQRTIKFITNALYYHTWNLRLNFKMEHALTIQIVKTTISIGQKKEVTFCAYIFEAKHSNSNHQLPNNLHLKNVSLKYKFYKIHTHNTSKFMVKSCPSVFVLCILLELVNSCLINSRNYKHIWKIHHTLFPKNCSYDILTQNCNRFTNVICVYQLQILCVKLKVRK